MRLTRREIIILVSLWVVVGGLIVAAVIMLQRMQSVSETSAPVDIPTPLATYTLPPSDVTARSLYPLAEEKAKGWREDAQLVSCSGTWTQTALNLVGRPVQWTYRFYSAQAKTLYFVTVTPDGRVAGTQHLRQVYQPPPILPVEIWEVDSPAALTNWLNYGGGQFLGNNPGIDVIAQLSVRTAGADPEWTIVGFNNKNEEFFTATVNAVTAQTSVLR